MQRVQQTVNDFFSQRRKHAADIGVLVLGVLYALGFSILSIQRHDSFNTGLDLALFDHYSWNLVAGYFLRNTIIEPSLIWNYYFSPLLVLVVPFYVLWSDARVLLILQSVALAFSVLPIYWYAKHQLSAGLTGLIAISFFLHPVLGFVNLSQFHIIALTIPLLSLTLYFLLKQKDRPFLVCVLLLPLVKEEGVLAVLGLGLYALFFQRRRWLGSALVLGSIIWFLALINIVFPGITGRSYFVGRAHLFGELGMTFPEITRTILFQPDQVWSMLVTSRNLELLWWLLVPLALIPLLGIDILLIAAPLLGMTVLTKTAWLESHYPAPFMPIIYFAAIVGLRRWRTRTRRSAMIPTVLLVCSSLVSYALISPSPLGGRFDPAWYGGLDPAATASFRQVRQLVPHTATVTTQEELLPHFSARRDVYSFPIVPDYRQIEYLVANKGLFFFNYHKKTWDAWMATGYFETIFDQNSFVLAQRRTPVYTTRIRFGDHLFLLGYTATPTTTLKGGMTVRPSMIWQTDRLTTEQSKFLIQVVDQQGHIWATSYGEPQDGNLPTAQWRVGARIGDQYRLNLPVTMPADEYHLVLQVTDLNGAARQAFDSQNNSLGHLVVVASLPIEKNKQSVLGSQLEMGNRLFADFAEIRLLGFELDQHEFKPGQIVSLGLYWRARNQPQGDYLVRVELRDDSRNVVYAQTQRPAHNAYPTTEWDAGEVLLDWRDLTLPEKIHPGTYSVNVALVRARDNSILGQVALTDIRVTGQ
ncbi:MAG: DUF2079 domain-containing protein [Chloroflexi bacterium]|nr:DUF2079 domain-containing protein [Chloroflexota bacterium]